MKNRIVEDGWVWRTIPFNVKVPKDYRRSFAWDSESMRQTIEVDGRRIGRGAIRYGMMMKTEDQLVPPKEASRSLDWMEECVERVRMELGG